MSSLASSRSSLHSTSPYEERGAQGNGGGDEGPPSSSSQTSFSFYSPTSLAYSASNILRRFYSDASDIPTLRRSASEVEGQHQASNKLSYHHRSQPDIRGGDGSHGVYIPPAIAGVSPQRRASPFQPPPLSSLRLDGLQQHRHGAGAQLLSRALAEEIRLLIPSRLQLVEEWKLAYSLERDGVSLTTLYKRCERWQTASSRRGFVIVVKDGTGALFGTYLSDAPQPSPHYYGTGECFLWRSTVLSSTSTALLSTLPPPPSSSDADIANLTRSTTLVIPQEHMDVDLIDIDPPVSGRSDTALAAGRAKDESAYESSHPSQEHGDDVAATRTETTLQPPPASVAVQGRRDAPTSTGVASNATASETIRFKAFPYSGVNDYLIFCEQKYLSVGGGDGRYGLWLDDVFEHGISSSCPTFGNEPLSEQGTKFDVLAVEVWVVTS